MGIPDGPARPPRLASVLLGVGLAVWPVVGSGCAPAEAPAASVGDVGVEEAERAARTSPPTDFARAIERLSEPGGYFDTDNLISNESSYLHVAGALRDSGLRGGAYIGVGPDQNFSYMAILRPEVAYLVDIRRDNLLQHLLYKALFEEGRNRVEFLSLLYGRPPPEDLGEWDGRSVHEITAWVDGHSTDAGSSRFALERVAERIGSMGVALNDDDWATIERFHLAFIKPGLDLRFTTYGRAPRFFYPTHRDLLLAEDLDGVPSSFLVYEEDYQYLRRLQEADAVIPVVGNLAGDHALAAVGQDIADKGHSLTAMYTSNVEFYLWSDRTFERFAETLSGLPLNPEGFIIRSYFGGAFREPHPLQQPGFYSAQLLQRFADFERVTTSDGFRSYGDLVVRDAVPLEGAAIP